MTYFDPEVYDWHKLKGDDAEFMAGYNYAVEELGSIFSCVICASQFDESTPTLNKAINEIQEHLQEETVYLMKRHRVELTCSLMENNLEVYGEDDGEE